MRNITSLITKNDVYPLLSNKLSNVIRCFHAINLAGAAPAKSRKWWEPQIFPVFNGWILNRVTPSTK